MTAGALTASGRFPVGFAVEVDTTPHDLLALLLVGGAWSVEHAILGIPLASAPAFSSAPGPAPLTDAEWATRWERALVLRAQGVPSTIPLDAEVVEALREPRFAWEQAIRASEPKASPERDVAEALVGAWRAGLRRVVVLPFGREWHTWHDAGLLVVSQETRSRTDTYAAALSAQPGA